MVGRHPPHAMLGEVPGDGHVDAGIVERVGEMTKILADGVPQDHREDQPEKRKGGDERQVPMDGLHE